MDVSWFHVLSGFRLRHGNRKRDLGSQGWSQSFFSWLFGTHSLPFLHIAFCGMAPRRSTSWGPCCRGLWEGKGSPSQTWKCTCADVFFRRKVVSQRSPCTSMLAACSGNSLGSFPGIWKGVWQETTASLAAKNKALEDKAGSLKISRWRAADAHFRRFPRLFASSARINKPGGSFAGVSMSPQKARNALF